MIPSRKLAAMTCLLAALGTAIPANGLAAETTERQSTLSLSEEVSGAQRGNEYVSGNYPGALLMPVNLWGAVPKPGIHHVPTQTNLLTLLSYAGGPLKDAEMGDLTIKRRVNGRDKVIEVDLKNLLTKPGQTDIALEPNDIVLLPQQRELVTASTLRTVGLFASLIGIVLSSFLLANQLRN